MKQKVFALFFLSLVLMAPAAFSEGYQGVALAGGNYISDSEITLRCNLYIEVQWRLWTMMAEPVDEERAAWMIGDDTTITKWPQLKRGRLPANARVPVDVLRKIRIATLMLWAPDVDAYRGEYGLRVDPGVMSKPFVYHLVPSAPFYLPDWSKLSAKEKDPYLSFTCPGSPDWDELFVSENNARLPAASAKKLVTDGSPIRGGVKTVGGLMGGIETSNNAPAAEVRIARVEWDLSPVREWLLKLDEEAIVQWERETADKEAALAVKKSAASKAEQADFWNTPANPATVDDAALERVASEARSQISSARTAIAGARQVCTQAAQRASDIIAAKQIEIQRRPKPGEGFRGRLARTLAAPAGWAFQSCDGERAYIQSKQTGAMSFLLVNSGAKSDREWIPPRDTETAFGLYNVETGSAWSIPRKDKLTGLIVGPQGKGYLIIDRYSMPQLTYGEPERAGLATVGEVWPGKLYPELRVQTSGDFSYAIAEATEYIMGSQENIRHILLSLPSLRQIYVDDEQGVYATKHREYGFAGNGAFCFKTGTDNSATVSLFSLPDAHRMSSITLSSTRDDWGFWHIDFRPAFTTDSSRMFATDPDGQVICFDTKDGKEVRRFTDGNQPAFALPKGDDPTYAIAPSPDGKYIVVSCSSRRTGSVTKLWDTRDGRLLMTPLSWRRFVSWGSGGRSLILGGNEGSGDFYEVYE
jgi:hypothetical protein